MADEWTPYDYDNPHANPLPPFDEDVWVHEAFYEGVTVGQWDGYGWETRRNKDDVNVTHWRSMVKPEKPTDFSHVEESQRP